MTRESCHLQTNACRTIPPPNQKIIAARICVRFKWSYVSIMWRLLIDVSHWFISSPTCRQSGNCFVCNSLHQQASITQVRPGLTWLLHSSAICIDFGFEDLSCWLTVQRLSVISAGISNCLHRVIRFKRQIVTEGAQRLLQALSVHQTFKCF